MRSNFAKIFGDSKLESLGYRVCGVVCVILCLLFQYNTDCSSRIDGQTFGHTTGHAALAVRNFVEFKPVVREICVRIDRQTDRQIHYNTLLP